MQRYAVGLIKTVKQSFLSNTLTGIEARQAYHYVNASKSNESLFSNKLGVGTANFKNQVRFIKKIIVKRIWPTPKLPFSYEFPEKVVPMFESMDADQTLGKIDLTQPKLLFEMSDELKDANEHVKRLFSLEMAPRREIVEHKTRELVRQVRQHEMDKFSEEVKIATLTVKVRSLQEHLRQHPYDKHQKRVILEIIQKRNSGLHRLRKLHLEKFHWLINKLGINYVRPLLGVEKRKPTRRGELRRMTKEYCENIRSTRLNAYHEKLKAQQASFLKEKEDLTKFIANEEKELGLIESK